YPLIHFLSGHTINPQVIANARNDIDGFITRSQANTATITDVQSAQTHITALITAFQTTLNTVQAEFGDFVNLQAHLNAAQGVVGTTHDAIGTNNQATAIANFSANFPNYRVFVQDLRTDL